VIDVNLNDHFSDHAEDYRRYRPIYPLALFEYLISDIKSRECAWDCGTGSGQAALALAAYFQRVIASDASAAQIRHAPRDSRVDYRVMPAERTDIESGSVDLVTAGQALHWFDLEPFYREVRRVLKPGGLFAAWCYGLNQITPAVDEIMAHYYTDIVGPHWPAERRHIVEKYQGLPFPFEELTTPAMNMQARWGLDALLGYLATWSATNRYRQRHERDPLDLIRLSLYQAWGPPNEERTVTWPIHLRVGRLADDASRIQ
jgi:SAM-dependent methyltransferase